MTNICSHYPDIRLHVYAIACRRRGDEERGGARLSTPHLIHVIALPPLQKPTARRWRPPIALTTDRANACSEPEMAEAARLARRRDPRLYGGSDLFEGVGFSVQTVRKASRGISAPRCLRRRRYE